MNAVSWSRQLPHMRQPNIAPFTRRSTIASARSQSGLRLNGKYGG
jgi:hypothetical protein